jgi:hypothetical protein
MDQAFKATEITIGFHQDGYRIDKTASPMNRYTIQNGTYLKMVDGTGRNRWILMRC